MATKTEGLGMNLYTSKDQVSIGGLSQNFELLDAAVLRGAAAPYEHAFVDGVHQLTGRGELVRFCPMKSYGAGEGIVINGQGVAAVTLDGVSLPGGSFTEGLSVLAVRQGEKLIFQFCAKASWGGNFTWGDFDSL